MLKYSIDYFFNNKKKIIKFIIVGASAFIVNFVFMKLTIIILQKIPYIYNLADILHIIKKNKFIEDVSNVISTEISVIFNFILSRNWTWKHITKHYGKDLYYQCIKFHLAILPGMIIRFILFPIFAHKFNMIWELNMLIGVGIATIINYILYDKVVFTHKEKQIC